MDTFGEHSNFKTNSDGFTQYCEVVAKVMHETTNPYEVILYLPLFRCSMHLICGQRMLKFKRISLMSILGLMLIASSYYFITNFIFIVF